MNISVGVSDSEKSTQKLIAVKVRSGLPNLKIREEQNGYVSISSSKKDFFKLCDILADIILEHIQVKMLVNDMRCTYEFIPDADKVDILVKVIKKLWYVSGADYIESVKKDVSNRVALCAFERDTLSLDGVVTFRMQDYVEVWRDALDDCVYDYIKKNEEREYVELLKFFLGLHGVSPKTVCILCAEGGYLLYDENALPNGEVLAANMLLSRLISLSPQKIYLDSAANPTVASIILRVFEGRVELC